MDTYDVIIAGCGPAGATAGFILARAGLSVAIVDRHVFPRTKLCGGMLPLKTMGLVERIFGVNRETLLEHGIVNYTSYGYKIFFRKNLLVHRTAHYPFSFVNRDDYDHFLMDQARSQGAHIRQGDRVNRVDPAGGVLQTESGRRYSARFIIGADGVNSVVRRCFPTERAKHWVHDLAAALEVFVPRSVASRDVEFPMVHLGFVNWGYGWVFPNRDRIIIGLGGLPEKNGKRFKQLLHGYLSNLDLVEPDVMGEFNVHGHAIPYGNLIRRPVYHKVVLVGDAAGLADPITGEGIYYAHRSAEIAAVSILHALREGVSLEETCLKLLRRIIFPDLLCARWLRLPVFHALRICPPSLIRRFVDRGDTRALQVIHGLRPYPFNFRSREMHGDIQV